MGKSCPVGFPFLLFYFVPSQLGDWDRIWNSVVRFLIFAFSYTSMLMEFC